MIKLISILSPLFDYTRSSITSTTPGVPDPVPATKRIALWSLTVSFLDRPLLPAEPQTDKKLFV